LGARHFTRQNLPMVSDSDCERLNKYTMRPGDIIFSRVGSVDRCSFALPENDGWLFSGRCLRVRPKEGVDPHFLYYYLSSSSVKSFVRNIAVGATMPSINTKLMGEIPIPLIDLGIQRQIGALLKLFDQKIESNQRTNDYLLELVDAKFAKLIDCETEEILLPEAISILSGGTPKTKEPTYWEDGDIPFFGPGDVKSSAYTLETEKHITELGLNNCNSSLYPINTVFLTARGTVGKVAIAGRPMAMNQSCFAFSGIDWVPQTYVYQIIKRAVRSLKAKANGATFAAINTRDLKDEPIPMPTRESVEAYDDWASPMFSLMLTREEESIRLANLRDALLPKLISGEIDVSEVELP